MRQSVSHIVIMLAAFVVLAFGSCTSRKKMVVPSQPKQFEWLTAHIDIEAEINGTTYQNLTGQLRMRHDSVLWASVSALGMEVVRLKMTTDSVWVLNRLEKNYLADPLELVSYAFGIPVSLPLVQNMLLGSPDGFAPEENQVVELKRKEIKGVSAKIRFSDIKLDEPTNFPCKITSKMENLRFMGREEEQP